MDSIPHMIKAEGLDFGVTLDQVVRGYPFGSLVILGNTSIVRPPLTIQYVNMAMFARAMWGSMSSLLMLRRNALFYLEDTSFEVSMTMIDDVSFEIRVGTGVDRHFAKRAQLLDGARALGKFIEDMAKELDDFKSEVSGRCLMDSIHYLRDISQGAA